jgi:MerR family transcriptional regulator, light-induced transcriptional regulator
MNVFMQGPPPIPLSPSSLLSPKDLARVIGVSESSLKRWIDDGELTASRTHGGHRRVSLSDALHFIRQRRYTVQDPAPLGIAVVHQESADEPLGERLKRALSAADAVSARSLVVSAYASGMAIAELCDGPIRMAMEAIGDLWHHDPAGIVMEHQATDICLQALWALRAYLPDPGPQAPLAIGGALSGDPYLMPSIMAAVALQECGFRTINLGPDTPLASFRIACSKHQPRLLWIAISSAESAQASRGALQRLIDDHRHVAVVVGGRQLEEAHLEPRSHVLRSRTMSEVVAYARGLLH